MWYFRTQLCVVLPTIFSLVCFDGKLEENIILKKTREGKT